MTCAMAMLSLFLLAPCENGGGHQAIEAAVNHPARPAADQDRDANRKPVDVLEFFNIQPGMTVLEVFAGGGYYSQILDSVVGEEGQVLAHNNDAYMAYIGPQYENRFNNGAMPNTESIIAEANDLQFDAKSLDAVLMVLTYHDFLFGDEQYQWQDVDEAAFLATLCQAMKPGAVLGLIDHVADPGGNATAIAKDIHRIDPQRVRADIGDSCFELEAESELLANPDDDHSSSATQGPLAGNTDRFVMKFVRK